MTVRSKICAHLGYCNLLTGIWISPKAILAYILLLNKGSYGNKEGSEFLFHHFIAIILCLNILVESFIIFSFLPLVHSMKIMLRENDGK